MADKLDFQVLVLSDHLPELLVQFPAAMERVTEAAAYGVQAYAKAHHPWQNQTGQTEASIEAERVGTAQWVVHFGGASLFLEWGTVHMPPFPFIQPAVDAVQPKVDDMLASLEGLLAGGTSAIGY